MKNLFTKIFNYLKSKNKPTLKSLEDDEQEVFDFILNKITIIKKGNTSEEPIYLKKVELYLLQIGEEKAKKIINHIWENTYTYKTYRQNKEKEHIIQNITLKSNLLIEAILTDSIGFFNLFVKFGGDVEIELPSNFITTNTSLDDISAYYLSDFISSTIPNHKFISSKVPTAIFFNLIKLKKRQIFNLMLANPSGTFFEAGKQYWLEHPTDIDVNALDTLDKEKFNTLYEELSTVFYKKTLETVIATTEKTLEKKTKI